MYTTCDALATIEQHPLVGAAFPYGDACREGQAGLPLDMASPRAMTQRINQHGGQLGANPIDRGRGARLLQRCPSHVQVALANQLWGPNNGRITTNASGEQRYVYQRFKWTD